MGKAYTCKYCKEIHNDLHSCPATISLIGEELPVNSYGIASSTFDPVQKPLHYNQGKFEVIDVIEDNLKEGFEAYCVGNVLKYVMRYKHKNGKQDLEKARWYLDKLIVLQKAPN